MSYWAKVQMQIKSLSIFTTVCEKRHLKVVGRNMSVSLSSGCYDVINNTYNRLARLEPIDEKPGTFDLYVETDYPRFVGEPSSNLTRDYAEEVVKYEASMNCWSLEDRKVLEDGSILLEMVVNY